MPATVVPTLEFMAGVYRLSTAGGPTSDRFVAYTAAAGELRPVHGYNPMTSKPVSATVEALLAVDAEGRLLAAATAAGIDGALHFTVATPGMWTDRFATEAEHRLLGRTWPQILWWFDDPVTVEGVDAAVAAQLVRFRRTVDGGAPATLADAVDQEGEALLAAGFEGRVDDDAAVALDVLADDVTLSTKVAFLWGDAGARALGYTCLGLADDAGLHHAAALARSGGARR